MISLLDPLTQILDVDRALRLPLSAPLAAVLLINGCAPSPALESQETTQVVVSDPIPRISISPPNLQLGYTLSVLIEFDTQVSGEMPHVTFQDWIYPAVPIGPQQWRAFLPTSPLDSPGVKPIRIQGLGIDQSLEVNVAERSFPTQRLQLSPSIANLEATEIEISRVSAFREQITPERQWQGFFRPPSRGPVTAIYGVRRYYNGVFAENYYHRGIDYASAFGGPITAPAAGQVGLVGLESEGFRIHGNTIGIDHGHGVTSLFLHMSRIDVQEGDRVEAGQVIGAVGATGLVTGPHLHWGLFVNGISVDPVPWMHLEMK